MAKSIFCSSCKIVKENPNDGYCKECKKRKNAERKFFTGIRKKQTGLCPCGKERANYSKSYCLDCLRERARKRTYTVEQREKINARVRSKRIKKDRKKIRLDPVLWIKEKDVRKVNRVNGLQIQCSRPNCENTENLLSIGWCKPCHAAYQKERRKYYSPITNDEQIIRHRVRSLTRGYIKSGKLIKQPCEICGTNEDIQAHHDDYDKPMDIRWLCSKHHREHHKHETELILKEK